MRCLDVNECDVSDINVIGSRGTAPRSAAHEVTQGEPLPVRPFRMEAALLERLPTVALTPRDPEGLTAWLEAPDALCADLVRAMLARGCKAEQEGWFLIDAGELGRP